MKSKTLLQQKRQQDANPLFLIEIKAVQNAMDKRGYDQGCDADKN